MKKLILNRVIKFNLTNLLIKLKKN